MVSHEASPKTAAGQSELACLAAEAAGGPSDTLSSANTMMFRLRQTVERCLGALLMARGAQGNPDACTDLAAILNRRDLG